MMRDFEKSPYSPDEARVAKFFMEMGIGGGDDPIGSLIASYRVLSADRKALSALIKIEQRTLNELLAEIAQMRGDDVV